MFRGFLQVGNFANDGVKLGRCSTMEGLPGGSKCSLWRHGGPTAAFVHLVVAFSLLVPKLVMEARLIEAGYLPQGELIGFFFKGVVFSGVF